MDRVTPEMEAAYVAWEPPVEIELKMPRVLGLLRAAFFAGWKARKIYAMKRHKENKF